MVDWHDMASGRGKCPAAARHLDGLRLPELVRLGLRAVQAGGAAAARAARGVASAGSPAALLAPAGDDLAQRGRRRCVLARAALQNGRSRVLVAGPGLIS